MQPRSILITESDMAMLRELLDHAKSHLVNDTVHIEMLEQELQRAEVVPVRQVPSDVITMGSKVRVRNLDTRRETVYELVFPREADISQGKVSVLAPIGTALLGYRTGDVIVWMMPGGMKRLKVEEVLHQPEAAELSQVA